VAAGEEGWDLLAQDPQVRLGQLTAGADPQLLIQAVPQLLEHLQGGGLLAGGGQGQHQQRVCLLVQRFSAGQPAQVRQHLAAQAGLDGQPGVLDHHRLAAAGELDHRWVATQQLHIGKRLVLPQLERPLVQRTRGRRGGRVCLGVPVGLGDQPLEHQQVQFVLVDAQLVATAHRHQPPIPPHASCTSRHQSEARKRIQLQRQTQSRICTGVRVGVRRWVGIQGAAYPAGIALHHVHRRRRRVGPPQRIDDRLPMHNVVGRQRQQAQHRPLHATARHDRHPASPHRHRPKHLHPQPATTSDALRWQRL
jgi:hypothetical protein